MTRWPYPTLVAHRGAGILAPENTLAAMQYAHAHGFHAVEFDVLLAQDDVPVLMHDPDFGRTVAGTGSVALHTAAELSRRDAGSWLGTQFAGEPVPTFAAIVRFCRRAGLWMNIEIKPVPGAEHHTGTVVARDCQALFADLLHAPSAPGSPIPPEGAWPAALAQLPLLSSFSRAALRAARDAAAQLPRALLVERVPSDWQQQCEEVGAVALHVSHHTLTREEACRITGAGYGLFCYTVNDVARARMLLDWGVDSFCTDRLDLFAPQAWSAC